MISVKHKDVLKRAKRSDERWVSKGMRSRWSEYFEQVVNERYQVKKVLGEFNETAISI